MADRGPGCTAGLRRGYTYRGGKKRARAERASGEAMDLCRRLVYRGVGITDLKF